VICAVWGLGEARSVVFLGSDGSGAVARCRFFSMGLVKDSADMEEGTLEIGMGESRLTSPTRSELAQSCLGLFSFVMNFGC